MFDWLFNSIAGLLSLYFDLTGSIGMAIVLLTLTISLLTFPLTLKQTRSMMAMQQMQPEIKKVQAKHKGDRQKMNEELMKLYQEHNINPLSGCLPLLAQMPIFIVLYNAIRGLANTTDGAPDPKYINHASDLFTKIVDAGGELISFGFDLGETALEDHGGFIEALPYYTLIVLVAGTAWFQQRQMMGRRDPNQPVNPQQQMMMRVMVFFLPLISLSIPAGVVVYFFVSNLFRVGQGSLIHRMQNEPDSLGALGRLPGIRASGPATESSDTPIETREVSPDTGPMESNGRAKPHPRSKKKKKKRR